MNILSFLIRGKPASYIKRKIDFFFVFSPLIRTFARNYKYKDYELL